LEIIAELKESIENRERQLESLDYRVSSGPLSTPTPVPPVFPSRSLKGVEFPLQEANSLKGIISAEMFMTK
jgi:hypothetical protein